MDVYFLDGGTWERSDRLFHALGLEDLMGQRAGRPYVIALNGAGGKTSLIRRLAREAMGQGLRVLVATTTHMAEPSRLGVFSGRPEDVEAMLDRESAAVAGRKTGNGKIAFVDRDFYETACSLADLVLVESDGSKRLPLKVPGPGEPAVPGNADMILCVSGLKALGEPAAEKCFRLEAAHEIMREHGRRDYMEGGQWNISPGDMVCLMRYGYLEPMRKMHGSSVVIPVFNQADTPELANLAGRMAEEMNERRTLISGRLTEDEAAGLF